MSSDLISYLLYIQTWDKESDANCDAIIAEHNHFTNVGNYDSDEAVEQEFKRLNDLACDVRDDTIAADATDLAANVAAVTAIMSFGLGMAAFGALEVVERLEGKVISDKSDELNSKLETIDADIANRVNAEISLYVAKYKANNRLIAAREAKGMDIKSCRANLMQFLAQVQKKTTLTANSFRQYASSARTLFESDEIVAVYDALDALNLSAKTDADVKKCMDVLVGLDFSPYALSMVHNMSIFIMFHRLNIANNEIIRIAMESGLPREEVDGTAFELMGAVGKFSSAVAIITSGVEIMLDVIDICDIVEQCKTMCDKLDGPIKQSYLDFFNGMKEASQMYNEAIAPN